MANIKNWLLEAELESGEVIEAIVVGKHDGSPWRAPANPEENVVLDRAAGLEKLDQEYNNGFGSPCCYPMYAWTPTRVYLIHEYDGSTGPVWVPRSPVDIEPEFGGQSC